jgi:hypothetical protein
MFPSLKQATVQLGHHGAWMGRPELCGIEQRGEDRLQGRAPALVLDGSPRPGSWERRFLDPWDRRGFRPTKESSLKEDGPCRLAGDWPAGALVIECQVLLLLVDARSIAQRFQSRGPTLENSYHGRSRIRGSRSWRTPIAVVVGVCILRICFRMILLLRRAFVSALLALAITLPAAALAQQHGSTGGSNRHGGGTRRGVPEFDVAAVGAIAAVIAGGGIVIARRRKSKS